MISLPASATEPGPAAGASGRGGAAVIRVLSYNIRSLRDDRAALARVIRACEPDLVLIQEAPRFFRWRKAAEKLARAAGLVYVSGGGTTAGPMILSTLRAHVERTEEVLLPRTPGLHQRGLALAVVRIGGARLGVLSCHLSLADRERYEQAGLLLERLAALDVPYAVAGETSTTGRRAAASGGWPGRSRTPGRRNRGAGSSPPHRTTRISGSTRSSPRRAWRCWAAVCRTGWRGYGRPTSWPPRIICRCWPPCGCRPAADSDHRATARQVVVLVVVLHPGHQGGEAAEEATDAQDRDPPCHRLLEQHHGDQQHRAADDREPGELGGDIGLRQQGRLGRGEVAFVGLVEVVVGRLGGLPVAGPTPGAKTTKLPGRAASPVPPRVSAVLPGRFGRGGGLGLLGRAVLINRLGPVPLGCPGPAVTAAREERRLLAVAPPRSRPRRPLRPAGPGGRGGYAPPLAAVPSCAESAASGASRVMKAKVSWKICSASWSSVATW